MRRLKIRRSKMSITVWCRKLTRLRFKFSCICLPILLLTSPSGIWPHLTFSTSLSNSSLGSTSLTKSCNFLVKALSQLGEKIFSKVLGEQNNSLAYNEKKKLSNCWVSFVLSKDFHLPGLVVLLQGYTIKTEVTGEKQKQQFRERPTCNCQGSCLHLFSFCLPFLPSCPNSHSSCACVC